MRYPADTLQAFACSLLVAAGLERDMAAVVAEVLLEGDLLGHDTHGLALLAPYLGELERGTMAKSGSGVSSSGARPVHCGMAAGCPGRG